MSRNMEEESYDLRVSGDLFSETSIFGFEELPKAYIRSQANWKVEIKSLGKW